VGEVSAIRKVVEEIVSPSSIRDWEGALLYKLARKCTKGSIVEIGSWKGRSTIWLAKGAPPGVPVYAIDPHQNTKTHQLRKEVNTYLEFCNNIRKAGVEHRVTPLVKKSEDALKDLENVPVGLLFIDGEHSYDAVKFDFNNWTKGLVEGGIVALHDAVGHPGPSRVVMEDVFRSGSYTGIRIRGKIVYAMKAPCTRWMRLRNSVLLPNWLIYSFFHYRTQRFLKALKILP